MSRFEEVSRVMYRYARALDDRRLDDLTELFSEDATLIGLRTINGRAKIRTYYEEYFASSWKSSAHFLANVIVDQIDHERAAVTCDYFQTAIVDDQSVVGWGRYYDMLRLEDGEQWRYTTKRNDIRALVDISAGWSSEPKGMLGKDWLGKGQ